MLHVRCTGKKLEVLVIVINVKKTEHRASHTGLNFILKYVLTA